MVAKMAITSAPPAMRAVTAAVGLQPASINALASGPDSANDRAELTAKNMPSRKWSTFLVTCVAVIWHLRHVMSKMIVAHDTLEEKQVRSQMIFSHDTELTLQSACVLVNT